MTPVLPAEFKALLPESGDGICTLISKYMRTLFLIKRWYKYAYNSDGSFSDAFIADLQELSCGTPTGSGSTSTSTDTTSSSSSSSSSSTTCDSAYGGICTFSRINPYQVQVTAPAAEEGNAVQYTIYVTFQGVTSVAGVVSPGAQTTIQLPYQCITVAQLRVRSYAGTLTAYATNHCGDGADAGSQSFPAQTGPGYCPPEQ